MFLFILHKPEFNYNPSRMMEIPDIPNEYSALLVARKMQETEERNTMKIYHDCVNAIKMQKFPCKVFVESNSSVSAVTSILGKLTKAGYVAMVNTEQEIERDYDNQYQVDRTYITIENPMIK